MTPHQSRWLDLALILTFTALVAAGVWVACHGREPDRGPTVVGVRLP